MLGLPGFISPTSNPFPEKSNRTELGPRARYPYSFIVCNLFHLLSSSVVFTGENQLTAHKLHLESV